MEKLSYFDANAMVGRVGYPHLLDIADAAGLKREMATAGIDEALVYHAMARYGDPLLGNAMLEEELKGDLLLHPVWVVVPHHTGEMPEPPELLRLMKDKGIEAVRMYPGRAQHSFSLAEWCSGDLLAGLEEKRLPLFLDAEVVTWEEVHDALAHHPDLPLIMTNCTYRFNRYLYPLFEKFSNLFVEISRFMGAGCLEDVVKRFGAGPLLFGTNIPQYTGTAAVALLTYAEIGREDKQAIAGGNLRKILREAAL